MDDLDSLFSCVERNDGKEKTKYNVVGKCWQQNLKIVEKYAVLKW